MLTRAQELIAAFERKHFQGYIHVTFMSSKFEWGVIEFRWHMSGKADGQIEFHSVEELNAALEGLVTQDFR